MDISVLERNSGAKVRKVNITKRKLAMNKR